MLPDGYIENYEQIAKDYMGEVSVETRKIGNLIDFSIQLLGIPFDADVLDLGCGNGWILRSLGCVSTYGADISIENCMHVRKLSTLHKIVQADAQKAPYKDCSFDAVICTDVFEHVPSHTELVKEIHRILRSNGVLFFSTPFEQDLSYYDSPAYEKRYRYVHLRSVNKKMLNDVFDERRWVKLAEIFVTEQMQFQDMPYPIIFQVYVAR